MQELYSSGEIGFVGTFYGVLTCGTVVFAGRLVQVIQAKGRADCRTLWRLVAIRAIAAVIALSGSLYVFLCVAMPLFSTFDILPTMFSANPRRIRNLALVPLFVFFGNCGILPYLATTEETQIVFRSFSSVRWLESCVKGVWSQFQQLKPVATLRSWIRRFDRRLW